MSMRSELIVIGVILKELKCLNLDSLSNRILLQKKMYLLQDVGVDLGYQYNWYVHGPYSTELTTAAYECVPLGEEYFSSYNLKDAVKQLIESVNSLENCNSRNKVSLNTSAWYELLASYLFWYKQYGVDINAKNHVLKTKPQFSSSDIDVAIEALQSFKS